MKINPVSIDFIQRVVNTAQIVGIDDIIIETDMVRAIHEDKTVVLHQTENVPVVISDTVGLGLNRLSVFNARLGLAKNQGNLSVEALVDDRKDYVPKLTIKGKRVKVEYRCANPATIKAPRQIKDEMKSKIQLNEDIVNLLQQGQAAMGADIITIISNDGVSFEMIDGSNRDVFSHELDQPATPLTDDEDVKFAFRYPVKTLLAMFKQVPDGYFSVGQRGILQMNINDLGIFVLPQA